MKYAVDRYKVGTETEVCADDYYGTYIPQRQSRFFCPECGEPVFWRSRGGTQPNKFVHYTKNERTPECDKRVDGRSGLSLYERIGLPLYLINQHDYFQLCVGFPALGETMLRQAAKTNMMVTISSETRQRIIYVNQTNFFDSHTTYVPIDFIPSAGNNYKIIYKNIPDSSSIKSKWSDYADGFEYGGAVFSCDDNGGKKIRRGDSICPGRDYYLVSHNFVSAYPEIKTTVLGGVELNGRQLSVYQLRITISSKETERFSVISRYLKNQFGVWLVETAPELIPLWPPVSLQDYYLPIISCTKVFCGVSSSNDAPSVYMYSGSSTTELDVQQISKSFAIEIPFISQTVTLSVDRKYVGREITFSKQPVKESCYSYDICIIHNNEIVNLKDLHSKCFDDSTEISTNAKLDLVIGSKSKTYQRIAMRSARSNIARRQVPTELYLVAEGGIIDAFTVHVPDFIKSANDEKTLLCELRFCNRGTFVAIPRWLFTLQIEFHSQGYYLLENEIKQSTLFKTFK